CGFDDRGLPKPVRCLHSTCWTVQAGASPMIYILAALLPPLGLLFNGQPFSALLNLVLIVPCLIFGLVFHVLLLVPSIHAVIAGDWNGGTGKHRKMTGAIDGHGAPPGWKP